MDKYPIPFSDHCELDRDLVFRIPSASLILFGVGIRILFVHASWDEEGLCTILGSL